MRTEIGRELQDCKRLVGAIREDEDGVFMVTVRM